MLDAFGEEPATVNGDMFQVSLHGLSLIQYLIYSGIISV